MRLGTLLPMPPERDLFANFERMRREIDELFGDVFERSGIGPGRAFTPEVDVYYCGQPPRAIVKAELAGVDIDEVSLETTRANAAANRVQVAVGTELQPSELAVMNIALDVVERMLPELPVERAITSGYLERDRPQADGWAPVDRRQTDGWAADLLERE